MPSLSLSAFVTLASFLPFDGFSVTAAQEASAVIIVEEQKNEPLPAPFPKVQIEVRVVEIDGALPEEIQSRMIDLHERVKTQVESDKPPEKPAWQNRPWGTMAILTAPEAAHALEILSTHKADILTLPRVVTVSGRTARLQIEADETITDPPFKAPLKIDTRGLCKASGEETEKAISVPGSKCPARSARNPVETLITFQKGIVLQGRVFGRPSRNRSIISATSSAVSVPRI